MNLKVSPFVLSFLFPYNFLLEGQSERQSNPIENGTFRLIKIPLELPLKYTIGSVIPPPMHDLCLRLVGRGGLILPMFCFYGILPNPLQIGI